MEIVGLLAMVLIAYWVFKWKSSEAGKESGSQSVAPQTTAASVSVQKQRAAASTKETAVANESVKPVQTTEVQQQAPVTVKPAAAAVKQRVEPEDSVLKRHYLAQQQAEKEALSNPYPTDSVLRRHHENISATVSVVSPAIEESVAEEVAPQKSGIPEDSTLRRHFLAQVQAEIESGLFPRPTDSSLIRHYDSLVKAKVDAYLQGA